MRIELVLSIYFIFFLIASIPIHIRLYRYLKDRNEKLSIIECLSTLSYFAFFAVSIFLLMSTATARLIGIL